MRNLKFANAVTKRSVNMFHSLLQTYAFIKNDLWNMFHTLLQTYAFIKNDLFLLIWTIK